MSSSKKAELIGREKLYEGFFSAERVELRHEDFNGTWTSALKREVMHIGGVAAVLLYDPAQDSVVLLEQFRTAAWLTPEVESPMMYECVAGLMEDGEDAKECAIREAAEESGCTVTQIERVFGVMPSPGSLQEYCNLFIGRIDGATHGGIFGNDHEGEHIRTHVIPVQCAFDMVERGEILHSLTVILLQWLRIHHQDLRERWTS